MKNLLFILAFLLIGELNVCSQPSTFVKSYNKGNMGYSVRELNGNTYVVAGGTDFYYNFHWFIMSSLNNTNIHLFKTSTNGNLIWEKIYSSLNHRTLSTWMEPVNDGGIIMTGFINSETTWPPDSNDIFLVKTDGNGNLSWAKTFDTGKDEGGYCVRQTLDNGFIISGFHDAVPLSLTGTTYAILIKTDSNGVIEWEKKYQIPVRDLDTGEMLPVVVSQTSDGSYVVTGTTAASHAADVFVFKTDNSGNLLWAKSYEHDGSVFRFSLGLDIIESSNGDLIVAGAMDKNRILNQFNYPYILRLYSSGIIQSAKILSTVPDEPFQSGFSSIEQTPDGGYFFTGMGGYSGFGSQAQLLKTDINFNTQWSRVYTMDGLATVGSRSGRRTTDGCYVFAGKKQLAGTILMKTDNIGLIPCKNPGSLIEIIPSVLVNNRMPTIISGINSTILNLTTLPSLTDTSTVCPVVTTSLPVELINFKGTISGDNSVILKWSTSSEINCSAFEVEKSINGFLFEKTGSVKAAGNSTSTHNYQFIDSGSEPNGIIYYRLKQVDFDGSASFSKTLDLHHQQHTVSELKIISDFQSQQIRLLFQNDIDGPFQIRIIDLLGREMSSNDFSGLNDEGFVILKTTNLDHGIYLLAFVIEGETLYTKFYY